MRSCFQVKDRRSFGIHLVEFLIAGTIFTGIVFFGLYACNFRIIPPQKQDGPKGISEARASPDKNIVVPEKEPLISTPLPSQEELIRQLIGASRAQKNEPPRPLAPWERQVQEIHRQPLAPEEKTRRLVGLANTLSGEDQARVYAAASASAPAGSFQQQLYPMVWNPDTPAPVVRVLAAGIVSQPDSFKLPALLALLKHSDEETRVMAESVLWAYFPDEPTNNYPQAVRRFLSGSY